MDDLVQFLKDRLAEDEEIAKDPTHATWATAEWRFNDAGEAPYVDLGTNHLDSVSSLNESEMRHIARHDPARVLAEVGAKRRLLAGYATAVDRIEELVSLCERLKAEGKDAFASDMDRITTIHRRDVLHEVLHLLALPYADHPDYRQSWRP
ncbi:DUF6221 family protein [[Kitasatospora] papulosa]|uniref:DUF6221 family protein n=1 Tax=[Kitasatospora] papulosa TaxID=1464011 RepID=UPI0036CDCE0C